MGKKANRAFAEGDVASDACHPSSTTRLRSAGALLADRYAAIAAAFEAFTEPLPGGPLALSDHLGLRATLSLPWDSVRCG